MVHIGNKQLRQFMGYLQEDVAKECGVSKKTVGRFELGTSRNKKLTAWYNNLRKEVAQKMK